MKTGWEKCIINSLTSRKRDQSSKLRSSVIERFTGVELFVNTLICRHYFGEQREEFKSEVLAEMSWASRLRLLNKIVGTALTGGDRKALQRLGQIRNIFAHSIEEEIGLGGTSPGDEGIVVRVRNPRKPGQFHDYKKLEAEFSDNLLTAAKALARVWADQLTKDESAGGQ